MLTACGHEEPFRPDTYTPDPRPFSGSARLTFNTGADRTPSWLADGAGILYSIERLDRTDQDRCLGFLPPDGGSLMRMSCHRTLPAEDSTDVFESPAAHGDGRLVYVRASSLVRPRSLSPRVHRLVLASVEAPDSISVLRVLPYVASSGAPHENVSQVQWLNDTQVVYLAERVAYARACQTCPPDTLRSGREIAILTARPGATVLPVPGTAQASSVAVGSPDVIYYTVNGDSRVFRRALSSGVVELVHDFGSGRVARDVQVLPGGILAVVDGKVGFRTVSGIGDLQEDFGGDLFRVDPGGTEQQVVVPGQWFRRPRVRTSDQRLVAEAYPYTITPIFVADQLVGYDTTVASVADLWLVTVP